MTHEALIYQENQKKLKANNLTLYWELENDPYLDVCVKTINDVVLVSACITKDRLEKWLDDVINEAIYVAKKINSPNYKHILKFENGLLVEDYFEKIEDE